MKINKRLIHTILILNGGNGFHKKVDGHQINFESHTLWREPEFAEALHVHK